MAIINKAEQTTMRSLVPPSTPKGEDVISGKPYVPTGPSVYVDVAVPELDGREVGSEFSFVGKGKLRSIEQRETRRGTHKTYSFELVEMGIK